MSWSIEIIRFFVNDSRGFVNFTDISIDIDINSLIITVNNPPSTQIFTNDNPFFNKLKQSVEATVNHSGGNMKTAELKENIISLSRYKGKETNAFHVNSDWSLAVIKILEAAKIITFVDTKTIKLYKEKASNNFISTELIREFGKIKIRKFNLSRLIHFCKQINENYNQGYFESVAFATSRFPVSSGRVFV